MCCCSALSRKSFMLWRAIGMLWNEWKRASYQWSLTDDYQIPDSGSLIITVIVNIENANGSHLCRRTYLMLLRPISWSIWTSSPKYCSKISSVASCWEQTRYLAPGVLTVWFCIKRSLSFSSSARICTRALFWKPAWIKRNTNKEGKLAPVSITHKQRALQGKLRNLQHPQSFTACRAETIKPALLNLKRKVYVASLGSVSCKYMIRLSQP